MIMYPAFELLTRKQASEQGKTRFYTGKPCIYGHDAQRLTSSGQCVVCHAIKQKVHNKRKKAKPVETVTTDNV